MIGTALWLAFLAQAPSAPAQAADPAEAAQSREAGQAKMRQWISCVLDGGKARAGAMEPREAVAEAAAGCLAERAATGEAIAAAERAAGNPVTPEQVDALLLNLDATIGAGAVAILGGKESKKAAKRR